MADRIDCLYCRLKHLPRHLCDAAKEMLDAMVARGDEFAMPTVVFDEPMPAGPPGSGVVLMRQVVVKGATVPGPGGVNHPALVFTGRDLTHPLPMWVLAATDDQLRSTAALVHDMAELAIKTANQQNAGGDRG